MARRGFRVSHRLLLHLLPVARLSDRLARDNHTHPSRIRSIVLATPGVVNPRSGAIEMAPNITGLGHLNVVGLLGEKLGGPVVFENDINLALLGEIWHGCAQNVANVAFLALGSGVGLGLYVNGQLVRGENGAAGEIGKAAGLPRSIRSDRCLSERRREIRLLRTWSTRLRG